MKEQRKATEEQNISKVECSCGRCDTADAGDGRALHILYETAAGRVLLRLLSARWVSRVCGAFLDSRLSVPMIKGFAERSGICMEDYLDSSFSSFNEFFTRRIRPELRPITTEPELLPSPCDGRLSAYRIRDGFVLPIKQSRYSIADLLRDGELADRYRGGICLVFRLCVDNYHRYHYIDAGRQSGNVFIRGRLHTVRPIALRSVPVFTENCREYTVMETEHFGTVTEVEVGAMLVGKIKNRMESGSFSRGEEKGMFLYGGSTVIVLLEDGRVELDGRFFDATVAGTETPVLLGQPLGRAAEAAVREQD